MFFHISCVHRSIGTYTFTFEATYAVHLAFNSLRPSIRDLRHWNQVASMSLLLSGVLSLSIGFTAYITFWADSSSNLFLLYPPVLSVNVARVLLATMMILTYPIPVLVCRELLVVMLPQPVSVDAKTTTTTTALDEGSACANKFWWLLGEKQFIGWLHVVTTLGLWSSSTALAILAPSLSAVLNLTGWASGTPLVFILPALFSIKLEGPTVWAVSILVFGIPVGLYGTYLSLRALLA